jgi:hypothetical protein
MCQPANLGRVRGDMQQLSQELHRLEGKGYKAYRSAPAKGDIQHKTAWHTQWRLLASLHQTLVPQTLVLETPLIE